MRKQILCEGVAVRGCTAWAYRVLREHTTHVTVTLLCHPAQLAQLTDDICAAGVADISLRDTAGQEYGWGSSNFSHPASAEQAVLVLSAAIPHTVSQSLTLHIGAATYPCASPADCDTAHSLAELASIVPGPTTSAQDLAAAEMHTLPGTGFTLVQAFVHGRKDVTQVINIHYRNAPLLTSGDGGATESSYTAVYWGADAEAADLSLRQLAIPQGASHTQSITYTPPWA